MRSLVSVLVLALGACNPSTAEPCLDADKFPVFEDLDGDGFGGAKVDDLCEVGDGQVKEPLDCDDGDVDIHPDGIEACDGIDNNCDGQIDEDLPTNLFYKDNDGDGFGTRYPSILACDKPDDSWVRNADDCDDREADVNPDGQEVCGGSDEDCDGLRDDADDSIDVSTMTAYFRDGDHDGKGDADHTDPACSLQFGYSENTLDCDDQDPLVGQYKFFHDADADGYGSAIDFVLGCTLPSGYVRNNLDCDDTDDTINIDRPWFTDDDGDGYGIGTVSVIACEQPAGTARNDSDCDDVDPLINPGADEFCEDGIDQDCNGLDLCDTCQKLKVQTPSLVDGIYTIDTSSGSQQVYCDMTTDGGGWTLVGSSRKPFLDQGTTFFSSDLLTLTPAGANTSIWSGLSDEVGAVSDLRVSCRVSGVTTVDLSFYDSPWYDELTAFTLESSVCFEETGGNHVPPPERRDNLTGDTRALGDPWNQGNLEGEVACNDNNTFVLDFDDGGVLGNGSDGTDWGEFNNAERCGTQGANADFFVWIRD